MLKKIINFIKYHNAFTIGLALVFVFSGVIFASEDVRDAVIGEEIITEIRGVDNTRILVADLENFDLELQITKVSEDEENYYVDYTYQTLGIKDSVWQLGVKEKHLTISKQGLGNRDLGLYLIEELGEVADYELSYLKEVQSAEKEKGVSKLTATIDYTGLIGLVLDVKEKVLPGYEPVIPEPKPEICDGLDNDLDNEIDEGLAVYTGSDIGQCQPCIMDCIGGQIVQTQTEIGPSNEVCGDNIDNNCNGEIDEGCCQPSQEICNGVDDDCDGFVDENLGQISCGIGVCYRTINVCAGGVIQSCVPGIPITEICDNIDNDCDGLVDEDNVCQPAVPSPSAPVCDAENLNLCLNETDCLSVGGHWYNDICNIESEPVIFVCDSEHFDLCVTQELCDGIGLYWYDDQCNEGGQSPTEGGLTPIIPIVEEEEVCVPLEEICNGLDDDCDGDIDEEVDCGATSCDASLNLVGEDCQNTCVEGVCQICIPTCVCVDGFSDCDSDLTNGCETAGDCLPPEPEPEPEPAEPPAEEPTE